MNQNITQLNIELSSHCNFKCAGCINAEMRRPKGHMSLRTLKSILETPALSGLQTVYFWLYGEPLLNPHIGEMTHLIEEYKFQKILSTNGSQMNKFNELDFLNTYNEIIVSINGLTENMYSIHHGKNELMTVIQGIEKYNKIRNNILTMQFVVSNMNTDQMEDAAAFAKLHGFDKLIVKTFNVMDQSIDTYNTFVPKDNNSRYNQFNQPITGKYDYNTPCLQKLAITWDGNVLPCCFDYYGEHVLGNIANEPTTSILTNKLNSLNTYRFCNDCTSLKILETRILKDDYQQTIQNSPCYKAN